MDIAPGTKNGEIFLGPLVSSKSLFSSMVPSPPMPDPIETPILLKSSSSRFNPESITHWSEAIKPNWINSSTLRIYFLSRWSSGLRFTVAANLVSKSVVSNFVIGETPLFPLIMLFQDSETEFPTGDIMPIPVITTLILDIILPM